MNGLYRIGDSAARPIAMQPVSDGKLVVYHYRN
jgi:hypothetical protein